MFIRQLSCVLLQQRAACRHTFRRKSGLSSTSSRRLWFTCTLPPWLQGSPPLLPSFLAPAPRHVTSIRTSWRLFSTSAVLLMDRGGREPPYKRRRSSEEETVQDGDTNRGAPLPPGGLKSNDRGPRSCHQHHHMDAWPQLDSRFGDASGRGQGWSGEGSKSKYVERTISESRDKDGGGRAQPQNAWSKADMRPHRASADERRSHGWNGRVAEELMRGWRGDGAWPQLGTSSKLQEAEEEPPPPGTESAVKRAPLEVLHRRWEPSPACGTKPAPPEGCRVLDFSVMSYNILSQDLLQDNLYLYQHCPPQVLAWTHRLPNLLAEIQKYDADVLCLQEVQEDHFENQIRPALEARGYHCEYKKRTGQKPDGCAIVFKTSRLSLLSSNPVEFFRPGDTLLDRDNVGLVLLLRPNHATGPSDSSNVLCVANTHLLYNPRRGDVKLAQLAILLAEIGRLSRLPDGSSHPVVLCGDFNCTPWSPLFSFLTRGCLEYRGLPISTVSGQEYSRGQRLLETPIWSPSLGINQQCQYESATESLSSCATVEQQISHLTVEDVANRAAAHASKRWRIEHGLNLRSSYPPRLMPDGRPAITTCHSRTAMMVDYILYTPDSLPGGRGLQLLGRLSLVGQPELQEVGGLPNQQHSSDHLPLLVRFRWVVTATEDGRS
ncbi:protein angel homolog 2 isoform X2 [Dunckerocampus dactyliophorus]|nr:protein angel homolog 2 isoform X2 [Dunckerocampus dactyliophorus]